MALTIVVCVYVCWGVILGTELRHFVLSNILCPAPFILKTDWVLTFCSSCLSFLAAGDCQYVLLCLVFMNSSYSLWGRHTPGPLSCGQLKADFTLLLVLMEVVDTEVRTGQLLPQKTAK